MLPNVRSSVSRTKSRRHQAMVVESSTPSVWQSAQGMRGREPVHKSSQRHSRESSPVSTVLPPNVDDIMNGMFIPRVRSVEPCSGPRQVSVPPRANTSMAGERGSYTQNPSSSDASSALVVSNILNSSAEEIDFEAPKRLVHLKTSVKTSTGKHHRKKASIPLSAEAVYTIEDRGNDSSIIKWPNETTPSSTCIPRSKSPQQKSRSTRQPLVSVDPSDRLDIDSTEAVTDPLLMKDINAFLRRELGLVNPSDTRGLVGVYREAFAMVIEKFTAYSPLLRSIYNSYEAYVREMEEKIQMSLLGDKALQAEKERYMNMQKTAMDAIDTEKRLADEAKRSALSLEQQNIDFRGEMESRIKDAEGERATLYRKALMESTVRREVEGDLGTYRRMYHECKEMAEKATEELARYRESVHDELDRARTQEKIAHVEVHVMQTRLRNLEESTNKEIAELKERSVDPQTYKKMSENTRKLIESIKNLERKLEWQTQKVESRTHYEPPICWDEMGSEYARMKKAGCSSEAIVRVILKRLLRAQKAERHVFQQFPSLFSMKQFLDVSDFVHVLRDETSYQLEDSSSVQAKRGEDKCMQPPSAVKLFISPLVSDMAEILKADNVLLSSYNGSVSVEQLSADISVAVGNSTKVPYISGSEKVEGGGYALEDWITPKSATRCERMYLSHAHVRCVFVSAFVGSISFSKTLCEALDMVCRPFFDYTTKQEYFANLWFEATATFCADTTLSFIVACAKGKIAKSSHYALLLMNQLRMSIMSMERTEKLFSPHGKTTGLLPRAVVVDCLMQTFPHKTPRQWIRIKKALFDLFPDRAAKNMYYRDLYGPVILGNPSPVLVEFVDQYIDEVMFFTHCVSTSIQLEAREHNEEGLITPVTAQSALTHRLPMLLEPKKPKKSARASPVTHSVPPSLQGESTDLTAFSPSVLLQSSSMSQQTAASIELSTEPVLTPEEEAHQEFLRRTYPSPTTVSAPIPSEVVRRWVFTAFSDGERETKFQPLEVPRVSVVEDSRRVVSDPVPIHAGGKSGKAKVPNTASLLKIGSGLFLQNTSEVTKMAAGKSQMFDISSFVQPSLEAVSAMRSSVISMGGAPSTEDYAIQPITPTANTVLTHLYVANSSSVVASLKQDSIVSNEGLETSELVARLVKQVALVPVPFAVRILEIDQKDLAQSLFNDQVSEEVSTVKVAEKEVVPPKSMSSKKLK